MLLPSEVDVSHSNPYTKDDDQYLVKYLATYNPGQEGRKGNALYKTLVANAQKRWSWSARHSWQSWRDHYVKQQAYFDAKIAKYLQRQAAKDPTQQTVQSPAKPVEPDKAVKPAKPVRAEKPVQPQKSVKSAVPLQKSIQKSPPKPDLGEGSSSSGQKPNEKSVDASRCAESLKFMPESSSIAINFLVKISIYPCSSSSNQIYVSQDHHAFVFFCSPSAHEIADSSMPIDYRAKSVSIDCHRGASTDLSLGQKSDSTTVTMKQKQGSTVKKQKVISSQDYSNTIFPEDHDSDEDDEEESDSDDAADHEVNVVPPKPPRAEPVQQVNKYTAPMDSGKYNAKLKRQRSSDSRFFESPSPRGSPAPRKSPERARESPGPARPFPAPRPVKLQPVPTYSEGPFGNRHRKKQAIESDTDDEGQSVKKWPPERKGKAKEVEGARRESGSMVHQAKKRKLDDASIASQQAPLMSQSCEPKPSHSHELKPGRFRDSEPPPIRSSSVIPKAVVGLPKSNNRSSSPLFTGSSSSSTRFSSRSETTKSSSKDFYSNSSNNPFVQGSSKLTRRYTIGSEEPSRDDHVPKLDLRVQLAKDLASKQSRRPSLPLESRRSRSSTPILPSRDLSRFASPALSSVSNDDQQTIHILGLQIALADMATESGFDLEVAKRLFAETGSLGDTAEALKQMQIVAGKAVDRYLKKKRSASFGAQNLSGDQAAFSPRANRASSPPGAPLSPGPRASANTPASPDNTTPARHASQSRRQSTVSGGSPKRDRTPSSRAHSRKPSVFRPISVKEDAIDVEYSPPTHSRAGDFVRLSEQGRAPAALNREETRADKILMESTLEQEGTELEKVSNRVSWGSREDQLLRDACESDAEELRELESRDKDMFIRKVYEMVRRSL
ncbi:hypothetical protein C8J56DRAFT_1130984 [Mycena floridula]|nr:hypothetical protein C8J56DRAFT_1130984 [Mycena floridula]